VDANDYLDVRREAWAIHERSKAVESRGALVYFNAGLSAITAALAARFPKKYTIDPATGKFVAA
jgi:hypothetical protein